MTNGNSSSGGGDAGSTASSAQPAPTPPLELSISLASGMQHVGQEEWDACATGGGEINPFLLHDFLAVLEESGSAVKEEGWLPQHVLVRRSDTGELLGCAPCYLKAHSYGEYVFDQARLWHGGRRGGEAVLAWRTLLLRPARCSRQLLLLSSPASPAVLGGGLPADAARALLPQAAGGRALHPRPRPPPAGQAWATCGGSAPRHG